MDGWIFLVFFAQITRKHKVHDALAYLLEKQGKTEAAFSVLMEVRKECFKKKKIEAGYFLINQCNNQFPLSDALCLSPFLPIKLVTLN